MLTNFSHPSYQISQLCESVAICSSLAGDRFNWGNGTETNPAFLVYLGCDGDRSLNSRPALLTKCEKWWRGKGLIPSGSQLGTYAIASIMGFPSDWFKVLGKSNCKNATTPNPPTPQDESSPDTSLEEPSRQHKQRTAKRISSRSLSEESSTSIPCLVRQIDKCSSKISPPSKIPPTKQRRKKGDGTGYIYHRTITRKGKQYEEFYYRYRDESGKLRSQYIPQRLLNKVEGLESRKLPVADVLSLLGGDEISRGEQFNTFDAEKLPNGDQSDESICLSRGEQATPPSKKRKQGYGGGYIECKPIKIQGKQYKQYWYHYEFWNKGDRTVKKCRYIQAHLVAKVQKLEAEKAPVREILKLLGVKI